MEVSSLWLEEQVGCCSRAAHPPMQNIRAAAIHGAVFKQADRAGDNQKLQRPRDDKGLCCVGREGRALSQGRVKQHLEGHQVCDLPKSNVPSSKQKPCSNKAHFLSAHHQHGEHVQAGNSLLWRLMYS